MFRRRKRRHRFVPSPHDVPSTASTNLLPHDVSSKVSTDLSPQDVSSSASTSLSTTTTCESLWSPPVQQKDIFINFFTQDFQQQKKSQNPFGIDRIIHGIRESK